MIAASTITTNDHAIQTPSSSLDDTRPTIRVAAQWCIGWRISQVRLEPSPAEPIWRAGAGDLNMRRRHRCGSGSNGLAKSHLTRPIQLQAGQGGISGLARDSRGDGIGLWPTGRLRALLYDLSLCILRLWLLSLRYNRPCKYSYILVSRCIVVTAANAYPFTKKKRWDRACGRAGASLTGPKVHCDEMVWFLVSAILWSLSYFLSYYGS